jgi:Rha family phage regulatory protein
MNTEPTPIVPEVAFDHGIPKTTSLEVARIFGKRHDNVLRDIEAVLAQVPDSFENLNFEEASYPVEQPKGGIANYRMYKLTKDGLVMLVMGYTGKLAMRFKVAYIQRFNEMEAELSRQSASVQGGGSIHCFRVTLDEWVTATHAMRDKNEEMKRIRLILKIEREALDGRR